MAGPPHLSGFVTHGCQIEVESVIGVGDASYSLERYSSCGQLRLFRRVVIAGCAGGFREQGI